MWRICAGLLMRAQDVGQTCWMRRLGAQSAFQSILVVFSRDVVRVPSSSSTPTLANYVSMDLALCTGTLFTGTCSVSWLVPVKIFANVNVFWEGPYMGVLV